MNRGTARSSPGRTPRGASRPLVALAAFGIASVIALCGWVLSGEKRAPSATGLTLADLALGPGAEAAPAVLEAGLGGAQAARAEAPLALDLASAGVGAGELAGLVPGRFDVRALEA